MRVAGEREIGQVLECLQASVGFEIPGQRITAEDLRHLDVKKVRDVQCLAGSKETLADPGSGRRPEQDLEDRRSVDNDHRPSRSTLTALAGGTRGLTAVRCASR